MTESTERQNRIEEVYPYLRTRDCNAAIEFLQASLRGR